jgi:Family of unknown function (DUF6191)
MSFFEIFSPGLRHLREERDRLKTLVTRPRVGAGGPLGIDLASGKATFTMPSSQASSDSEESTPTDDSALDDSRVPETDGPNAEDHPR